jgi:transposase
MRPVSLTLRQHGLGDTCHLVGHGTRLAARQVRSAPILVRIDDWLMHYPARAFAKSPLGEALAYVAKYRDGLGRFLTD